MSAVGVRAGLERVSAHRTVGAALGAIRREHHRRRVIAIALIAGYLLHLALRLWLTQGHHAPVIHSDEDGYLLGARAIAGGPGGSSMENPTFHRVGYPLLLAPIYLFTSDARTVYHAALAINAVLSAAVFPLSYLFARRVLGCGTRWALGLGFAATCLPGVVFHQQMVMTDAIFPLLGLGWLLLLHRAVTAIRPTTLVGAAAGAGAVAGYTHVVHVRGTVVLAAHAVMLVVLMLLHRNDRGAGWTAAIGAAVTSLATLVLATRLDPLARTLQGEEITPAGGTPDSRLTDGLTTTAGLLRTISDGSGQLWTLSAGTWGVGAVGLLIAIAALLTRSTSQDRRLVYCAALLMTLGIAIGSAAALPPLERVSFHAYGRYLAFTYPIWLMIGMAGLVAAARRRVLALGAGALVLLAAAGGLAMAYANADPTAEELGAFEFPEVAFLAQNWVTMHWMRVSLIAALLLVAGVGCALSARTRPALLALSLGMSLWAAHANDHAIVDWHARDNYATAPDLIRDAGLRAPDRVAVSENIGNFRYMAMREVHWERVRLFNDAVEPAPTDADVVLAPTPGCRGLGGWDGTAYGFAKVAEDTRWCWAVWRRP